MTRRVSVSAVVFAVLFWCLGVSAQVPGLISYQGRVAVGGVNFDGSGQFRFAMVNADGTTAYWSNDGSLDLGPGALTASSQPTASIALTVNKGLYAVLLGDTALSHMTAVPATVFGNPDVRLRVWFDDGTHGVQLLSPDQRFGAVGYALTAASAQTVPDGAITAAKVANGAIGSAQLAPGITINGALVGSASTFTGSLAGDVTGTESATVVASVGGSSAANIHTAEAAANAATDASNASTLVKRDASGSFSTGTLTLGGALNLPSTTSAAAGAINQNGVSLLQTAGTGNLFLGLGAGSFGVGGPFPSSYNTGVGDQALSTLLGAMRNTGTGYGALASVNHGTDNTAVGYQALATNGVSYNTAVGSQAIGSGGGSNNTAVGFQALYSGGLDDSVAIGSQALYSSVANRNIAIGSKALYANTGGLENVGIGHQVLTANSMGFANTAVGNTALWKNTTGFENTALGYFALSANITGGDNTALGWGTLSANTTGGSNIAIGKSAGNALTTGSNNIAIGSPGVAGESNTIRIGDGATQTDTYLTGAVHGNGTLPWVVVSGTSQQAASNTGYVLTSAAQVTVTLPASPAVGDIVRVTGAGAGGWKIGQNGSQSISAAGLNSSGFYPRAFNGIWTLVASSADGTKLVAANYSALYTSVDSGSTWNRCQNLAYVGLWSALASSADGSKLVAVVGGGFIYTSTDSGANWTPRASSQNWSAVASSADGTKLIAAVQNGLIYTSTDSGASWTSRGTTDYWNAVASSADGTKLVAAASQIYTSTNSGVTWTSHNAAGGGGGWTTLASSADGSRLVAAGPSNIIVVSADSGITWSTSYNINQNWYSVASSSDGTNLAAVVFGGQIYLSKDSGTTWTAVGSVQNWTAVAMSADARRMVALVRGGQIFTSTAFTGAGVLGYLSGAQFSAIELQYIGNGQFIPLSFTGNITPY